MADNNANTAFNTDPLTGADVSLQPTGTSSTLPGPTNEIEIRFLGVEQALSRISVQHDAIEALSIPEGTGSWTGPGAEAMSEALAEVEAMKVQLLTTLDNASKMLKDAYEAFDESDDAAASALGQL